VYYLTYTKAELQRPVSNVMIGLSLLGALFFNAFPWQGVALVLRPDAVAVVLLYWCMHKPARIGIGMAWIIGLLADVADANVLGQHALAYSALAYGSILLNRRLQMFHLHQQMPQVFGIFTLSYAIYAFTHWQINHVAVWWYFIGCFTSTLLWMILSIAFHLLRQLRVNRDDT
jgi:rod shape-determining protein MreD